MSQNTKNNNGNKNKNNKSSSQNNMNSEKNKSIFSTKGKNNVTNRRSNGGLNIKSASSSSAISTAGSSSSVPGDAISLVRSKSQNKTQKEKERAERESIVLWRSPKKTIHYSILELVELSKTSFERLQKHRALFLFSIILSLIISGLNYTPGPHHVYLDFIKKNLLFILYWLGLGVISSIGLGTGLHTFLLYLGPHIARVTLAAYECESLSFPQPPYPDDILCPEEPYLKKMPNIWNIMTKVRFEAFLWGAGTALGELPPYFMARAARRSGYDPDDAEELAEFEALKATRDLSKLSIIDKGKLFMERVVEKVGFIGILACASIPNPLFDLAGITCGHFLVPFWTFFGATLIGKAVVKMHLQKVFVIIAFNESLIERAVEMLDKVPVIGKQLQTPFKEFLNNQKSRLHRSPKDHAAEKSTSIAKLFEAFVILMVCYFILSILNSLAQNYHKRLCKGKSGGNTKNQINSNVAAKKVKKIVSRD